MLLSRHLLPVIETENIASDVRVFQRDKGPVRGRARETLALLTREMPVFIGPDLWRLVTEQSRR